MKHHKFLQVMKMLIINAFLIMAGCTVLSPAPTPLGESLPSVSTVVVSRVSSTHTPVLVTQIPTPSITPSMTPAPSVTPSPAVQSTATETFVAIPTPPGLTSSEKVLWLLETNNGCQLPCWWGITPGETTWEEAEQFFNTFAPDISSNSNSELVNYSPLTYLPSEVFDIEFTHPVYSVRNGIVDMIRTDVSIGDTPFGYLTQYTLSAFLTTYGQPVGVWLSTYPGPFEQNDLPFRVVLFYPDQGIAALYSDNGARQEDMVQGCPQQDPVRILKLWSPTLDFTFEQLTTSSSAFNMDYLSLEESTEMDVVTFYETFKNPDNATCLETPAELWH